MKLLKMRLVLNSIKHLKEKSCYNCNYYEVEPYGDWCCFFDGNNIIKAVCHEEENYYTFTLGHSNNEEEFVGVLSWDSEVGEDLFDYIKE
jgi:hypothetical protein